MGHVSHGWTMLGAEASRMSKEAEKRRKATHKLFAVWIRNKHADRLASAAAAAGLSAPDYIRRKLRDKDVEYRADLAALACLMRIAEAAAAKSQSSSANIEDAAVVAESTLTDAQVQRMIDALCGSVVAHIGNHEIPSLEEIDDAEHER